MDEGYVNQRNNYIDWINDEYKAIDKNLDIISNYCNQRKKYETKYGSVFKVAIIDAYIEMHKKIISISQKRISYLEKNVENLDEAFFICEDEDDD